MGWGGGGEQKSQNRRVEEEVGGGKRCWMLLDGEVGEKPREREGSRGTGGMPRTSWLVSPAEAEESATVRVSGSHSVRVSGSCS